MNILKNRKEIITYTISKNINSNLYISVQNGEVVVKAPWYLSRKEIQELVEEKRNWILEKIQEYNEKKEKEYIRSEIVKILGEDCKVKVNYKNLKKPELTVEGKNIKIVLPNKYKKMNKEEILVALIEKLYNVIAEKEVELAMEKMRKMLGYAPEDYEIKRMENCLGKCKEDGRIIINPDIVKYKREIIEFVVLHEYCHLKYKIHSKSFNEMMKKYMPKYENYAQEVDKIKY